MYNSKVSVTRKDDSGICSEGVCFQKDGIVNYNGFIVCSVFIHCLKN